MEKYNNWKRKFYAIWAGQAVSLITSAILQMAIIFYLTEKTGSAMVLSMASLVGFLPYAILGPAIGVLVDRHDRKKIMIGADLIIAAAGAVLAIVAFCMELPVWMIMIVLFIRSIGTAFHTPALNAVTPLLVPEEQLTKCAGYSQSLQSISYIVSPAVAALLYSVWDLNAIIAIDVLGAVIASITVAIVRIPKLGNQVQSLEPNFIREMKEGVVVLRQNKGLFALLLLGTLYTFVYMPINALFPLISMEHFNGTPVHISITEISFAFGMLAGGLLLGRLGGFEKHVLLITSSFFIMGTSLAVSGILPPNGFVIFVVCCAIMGLSVPFYSGVQTALFQEKIDTVQAFGLRRREVGELNKESFLIDKQGKMYIQTVGKGNKYRIAPVCDKEMNEKMKKLWSDKAIPLEKADEGSLRRILRNEDRSTP